MEKPNLYAAEDYTALINRVEKITIETLPLWGKMDAAQMFGHCAEITEVFNGKELKGTPWLIRLFKGFIKKGVINDKPYKKNSPTHPQYIVKGDTDFEDAKSRLLKAMSVFHSMSKEEAEAIDHTLFGTMTLAERSWGLYKHHNHHLEQFGV